MQILSFVAMTCNNTLTLEADNSYILNWYIKTVHAIHPNMKSHTSSIFTMSKHSIASGSVKQKYYVYSFTESKLNSTDD